jgi:D-glycero-alpha-D-manno-heptose 1-phosphate guanylyltransferase
MPTLASIKAMVLAGGRGTRLQSVLQDTPKVLAPVAGRPFIAYLLDQLAGAGIGEAILCTGYWGEQVKAALGAKHHGVRLTYSQEPGPLGTGGALRHALSLLQTAAALVMNGDSFCDVDLDGVWQSHTRHSAAGSIVLTEVKDTTRYGSVSLAGDGAVTAFSEKGAGNGPGWINAGVYVIARDRLEQIPADRAVSLEREVMPGWVGQGLYAYKTRPGTRFIDIGIPKDYAEAGRFFERQGRSG